MKLRTSVYGLVLGATLATPAWACSICRCGDPTFNALGKEGIAQTGFRMALDWDQVKKTEGAADERASLTERRTTALFAYGLSERFGLFARLPYSERELTEQEDGESQRTRVSGLSDPEIYGHARLWSSGFDGEVGVRASVFAVLGVKTPWGENDASRGGTRLDEHVQPGTGSTDWFGGLAGSYQIDPRSAIFASAQYRHTDRNDAGYRYGRIKLLNLAYERKLTPRWDAVLEANYRHAGLDATRTQHVHGNGEVHVHAGTDPNTGGSIVYVTPRLLFDVGGGWVLRASGQIPLSQGGLNGEQREKTVVNVGVTRLFKR